MKNFISKSILVINTLENFPTAFRDRLGMIQGRITYQLRNGLKFIARAGTEDLAEIAVVGSGKEYNFGDIFINDDSIIVDLGGHIGTFSILSSKLFKKSKIFTFEPDGDNYSLLKENIELNKVKNIKLEKIAISDYDGKGFLFTQNKNTDAYFLSSGKGKFNCQVKTLMTAMKNYKVNKIDLLKMDIEGGEYAILQDSKTLKYIIENVHYIFMEYHEIDKNRNYAKIKKIIEDNFYILNKNIVTLTLENKRYKYD